MSGERQGVAGGFGEAVDEREGGTDGDKVVRVGIDELQALHRFPQSFRIHSEFPVRLSLTRQKAIVKKESLTSCV